MSTLLLGRWDHGTLLIEESHQVADDDQEAIDALVEAQDNDDNLAWAATFDVDFHPAAVQRAYEEYVRDGFDAEGLVDEAEGFEPQTD
uniref:hypothetical protein n=1 Tax=Streptomyces sp. CA-136453 TaxID=3240050 RepID=UPI003F496816